MCNLKLHNVSTSRVVTINIIAMRADKKDTRRDIKQRLSIFETIFAFLLPPEINFLSYMLHVFCVLHRTNDMFHFIIKSFSWDGLKTLVILIFYTNSIVSWNGKLLLGLLTHNSNSNVTFLIFRLLIVTFKRRMNTFCRLSI